MKVYDIIINEDQRQIIEVALALLVEHNKLARDRYPAFLIAADNPEIEILHKMIAEDLEGETTEETLAKHKLNPNHHRMTNGLCL